jgi:hypothetical protein
MVEPDGDTPEYRRRGLGVATVPRRRHLGEALRGRREGAAVFAWDLGGRSGGLAGLTG